MIASGYLKSLQFEPGQAARMLPKAFDAFIQKRPICVMAQAVVQNLFQPGRLDALFERMAEKAVSTYAGVLLGGRVDAFSGLAGRAFGLCRLSAPSRDTRGVGPVRLQPRSLWRSLILGRAEYTSDSCREGGSFTEPNRPRRGRFRKASTHPTRGFSRHCHYW